MITEELLTRHRGPFTLVAFRPKNVTRFGRKEVIEEKEIVGQGVGRDEVFELIESFLTDPRDSITSIHVWSERDNQFLGGMRKQWLTQRVAA